MQKMATVIFTPCFSKCFLQSSKLMTLKSLSCKVSENKKHQFTGSTSKELFLLFSPLSIQKTSLCVSLRDYIFNMTLQSNLCITATLGTLKLRPLLTGGRCSEVAYIIEIEIGPLKWWPL